MTDKAPLSASEEAYDFPLLLAQRRADVVSAVALKRAIDVAVSAIILLLLSPVLALVAVVVWLDSGTPVLYRAVRVGKKGRHFVFYKFRTMVNNAHHLKPHLAHLNEREGPLFKIAADPRMTRVGKWLRKFSLDELPQLWNVLTGDMSLVGPRPPDVDEIPHYRPEDLRTLDVTPGITGLWQIKERLNPSFETKMTLDREYIEKWNLWLDCKILLKTIPAVLKGEGQ